MPTILLDAESGNTLPTAVPQLPSATDKHPSVVLDGSALRSACVGPSMMVTVADYDACLPSGPAPPRSEHSHDAHGNGRFTVMFK